MNDRTQLDISGKSNKPSDPMSYDPTDKERLLLEVLLNPYHRMASVKRICEVAGCSREFYYTSMRKPEFSAYYQAICLEAVRAQSAKLVHIGLREAQKGGGAGYQYWRDLMKMAKLLEDDKLQLEVPSEITVRFASPFDTE